MRDTDINIMRREIAARAPGSIFTAADLAHHNQHRQSLRRMLNANEVEEVGRICIGGKLLKAYKPARVTLPSGNRKPRARAAIKLPPAVAPWANLWPDIAAEPEYLGCSMTLRKHSIGDAR